MICPYRRGTSGKSQVSCSGGNVASMRSKSPGSSCTRRCSRSRRASVLSASATVQSKCTGVSCTARSVVWSWSAALCQTSRASTSPIRTEVSMATSVIENLGVHQRIAAHSDQATQLTEHVRGRRACRIDWPRRRCLAGGHHRDGDLEFRPFREIDRLEQVQHPFMIDRPNYFLVCHGLPSLGAV